MHQLRNVLYHALIVAFCCAAYAQDAVPKSLTWSNAERVYEWKIARKGNRDAMYAATKKEAEVNPSPWAKTWLAYYSIHAKSMGVKPELDSATAWKYIEDGMRGGSVFAYTTMGNGLIEGIVPGRKKDPVEGARLVMLAAEAGHPTSMISASYCYFFGVGVLQDRTRAIAWARRASYSDATMGLEILAGYYAGGVYVVPADKVMAARLYYEQALHENYAASKPLADLAKSGVKEAEKFQNMLILERVTVGWDYYNAPIAKAVNWLEKNYANDPEAMALVGAVRLKKYYHTFDSQKAAAELEAAAAKGNDDAAYFLAEMKLLGLGTKKDEAGGLAEIRRLAAKGNPKAISRLGWAYYWGPYKRLGADKNPTLAFHYAKAAADLGDWFGLLNTGYCYEYGIGVKESYDLAYWYFGMAAKCGSGDADEEARRLQPFITK